MKPAGRRWWSVLRVVLVAAWVLWAAAGWWTAPRQASLADARADLAAGRVAVYQWADGWDEEAGGVGFGWNRLPSLRSSGEPGPLYVWRTTTGQVRYADLINDSADRGVPGLVEELGGQAAAAGVEFGDVAGGRAQSTVEVLLPLLGLSSLILLVAGPAPVIGTKWFWWWVVTGVPFGLGLLAWLAWEHPWSPGTRVPGARVPGTRAPGARTPRGWPGPESRRRGLVGLGLAIAASLAGSLLTVALNSLLGDAVVPVGRH